MKRAYILVIKTPYIRTFIYWISSLLCPQWLSMNTDVVCRRISCFANLNSCQISFNLFVAYFVVGQVSGEILIV